MAGGAACSPAGPSSVRARANGRTLRSGSSFTFRAAEGTGTAPPAPNTEHVSTRETSHQHRAPHGPPPGCQGSLPFSPLGISGAGLCTPSNGLCTPSKGLCTPSKGAAAAAGTARGPNTPNDGTAVAAAPPPVSRDKGTDGPLRGHASRTPENPIPTWNVNVLAPPAAAAAAPPPPPPESKPAPITLTPSTGGPGTENAKPARRGSGSGGSLPAPAPAWSVSGGDTPPPFALAAASPRSGCATAAPGAASPRPNSDAASPTLLRTERTARAIGLGTDAGPVNANRADDAAPTPLRASAAAAAANAAATAPPGAPAGGSTNRRLACAPPPRRGGDRRTVNCGARVPPGACAPRRHARPHVTLHAHRPTNAQPMRGRAGPRRPANARRAAGHGRALHSPRSCAPNVGEE